MSRRPRKSRAEWQSLIEQFKQSGINMAEFCQQHDVSEESVRKWRSRFSKKPSNFSKVPVKSHSGLGTIRCLLPNGLRLEWDESASLSALLPMLRALA